MRSIRVCEIFREEKQSLDISSIHLYILIYLACLSHSVQISPRVLCEKRLELHFELKLHSVVRIPTALLEYTIKC